ncbi:hypothetical protein JCM9279_007438 [Rhodotorula babjevae]
MLDRDALLFSPTRDGVPSSDDQFTADDLLGAQDALEAEARETLPYRFDQCTYDLGYIKQPLWACRTCLGDRAVCAACSIACHASHELVELFNRRSYRCDCGTAAMGAGSCCSISGRDDADPNTLNRIDDNFRGKFCYCGKPYDPHTETDDMLQCLVCEDWLHAACVGLPHSDDDDDPTKPLRQDDFDQLVCWRCVEHNSDVRRIMTRYAGVEGTGVLLLGPDAIVLGKVRSAEDEDEGTVKGEGDDEAAGSAPAEPASTGRVTTAAAAAMEEGLGSASDGKRKAQDGLEDGPVAKRAKAEDASAAVGESDAPAASSSRSCLAPPVVPVEDSPLVKLERGGAQTNVYFEEGFMDRWCRCRECLAMFLKLPFFLEEEEVFEPPEDPDAHKSTFELGMNHLLTRMPRIQAINSLQAFGGLSDRLKAFFRPHADSGTTITSEHIKSFFDKEKERERGPQ